MTFGPLPYGAVRGSAGCRGQEVSTTHDLSARLELEVVLRLISVLGLLVEDSPVFIHGLVDVLACSASDSGVVVVASSLPIPESYGVFPAACFGDSFGTVLGMLVSDPSPTCFDGVEHGKEWE